MLTEAPQKSQLDLMVDDLAKSGLEYQDMLCRVLDESSRTTTGLNNRAMGYVIPYFDMYGKMLQFYRVKLTNVIPGSNISYLQVKNTSNHIYFPKNFMEVFQAVKRKYLIVTEGEKKAALACKKGIPCIALGGVDSWRNKTIFIPKNSEISDSGDNKGLLQIKLPSHNFDENMMSPLARGLQELIELCNHNDTTVVICFDTDTPKGLAHAPQRAAARLGYELRHQGFPMRRVKQLTLPHLNADIVEKVGLDDFLLDVGGGVAKFRSLLQQTMDNKNNFPRHPNIREHIGKMLARGRMDRKQTMNLGLSIVTELDARGIRMYSPDNLEHYYFNGETKELMKVDINTHKRETIHDSQFGKLLYQEFNIAAAADTRIMAWLGAQFAGEDPVETVYPNRVIARHQRGEDIVRMQINNNQYIKVTGSTSEPFKIVPNGTDKVLFESEVAHGIDGDQLLREVERQNREYGNRPPFWWRDVMSQVRLKDPDKTATITALLYYISPFLFRWRGTQLPVELVIGEAGSGKSTLSEVRLQILQGDPKLRNTPGDFKDWHASIANSGGLHITDNVHMTDRTLKQRISDDLCRLVTEPDPRISMRKYFTESDEVSIRVNSVFGFTAIQMPFPNSDLIQRAMILELNRPVEVNESGEFMNINFDSYWKEKQLNKHGGRVGWLAHHMHVLHCFFREVEKRWDTNYKSRNRLVNLEQILVIMGEIMQVEGVREWIPPYLTGTLEEAIVNTDASMEALIEYASYVRRHRGKGFIFTASDVSLWAEGHEDYCENKYITQPRTLGRYLQNHKNNIAQIAGVIEHSRQNNKVRYQITGKATEKEKKLAAKETVQAFRVKLD